MNFAFPELRAVTYFLGEVQPFDEEAAGSLTDVETAGSLATRVAQVSDLESPEWQNDILPRVVELAESFLPRHHRVLAHCSFASWGLSDDKIDSLLLAIAAKAKQADILHNEEERGKAFFSLLKQTKNQKTQCDIISRSLSVIHRILSREIESLSLNEKLRYQIAKIGATCVGEAVSENIQRFKITSAQKRLEIAKGSLRSFGSRYLDRYEIEDEEKRLELAHFHAANGAWGIFCNFKNYRISKETDRVQVVKSALQNHPDQGEEFCKYFHNCEIEDLQAIFEIAQLINPKALKKAIRQFPFTAQQRFELLMRAAEKTPEIADAINTASCPKEEHRIELYRKLLTHGEQFGGRKGIFLRLQIQNGEALLSFAEGAAKESNFCSQIKMYRIARVEDRIRLAKINILEDHFEISLFSNFEIPIEQASTVWAAYFIDKPDALRKPLSSIPPDLVEQLAPELPYLRSEKINEPFLASRTAPFKALYLKLKEERDSDRLCRALAMMQVRIQILHYYNAFSRDELDALNQLALALNETWTPAEREYFGRQICHHFLERAQFDAWYSSLPRTKEKTLIKHCLVPAACFSLFGSDNYGQWIQALQSHGRLFRDGKKAKVLMAFFHQMHKVLPKGKPFVEQVFYGDDDPYLRTILLSSLYSFGKRDLSPLPLSQLIELRQEIFRQELRLPLSLNLERVNLLLEEWRDPQAIPTYLSKIKELPPSEQEPVKEYYARWLESLLTDTFIDLRRESPHRLELLKKGVDPALLQKWEEGSPREEFHLEALSSKVPLEERFLSFLTEKLIRDKHIAYLPEICPTLALYLTNALPVTMMPENEIEKKLLTLCQKATFETITELGEMLSNVASFHPNWKQFSDDLQELRKTLFNEKKNEGKPLDFIIYDTDDPQDLLLFGNETGGCQRLYGESCHNKAALGYTDWKNRLIAIKNPTSPKIVSRSVIRLLWDENAKKAALFLERNYSFFSDPRVKMEINRYALQMGKKLDLPVFTAAEKETKEDLKYQGYLVSFGSIAPREYSDGFGGQTKGTFKGKGVVRL